MPAKTPMSRKGGINLNLPLIQINKINFVVGT